MTRWILILILAILGTVLVAVAGLGVAPYGERAGWAGALLIGVAVCLIAAANVG
jgi:hypothetical protein